MQPAAKIVVTLGTITLLSFGALHVTAATNSAMPMDEHTMPIDHQVEMAHTKADHEAVARRFESEAFDLDKRAVEHEVLAKRYSSGFGAGPKGNTASLASHCARLAASLRASAQEAREMAKMHYEMANHMER